MTIQLIPPRLKYMNSLSCIIFFLLLPCSPNVVHGQSDRELAEKIVAYLPDSMHGWTWESFSEEQFRHVQEHGALYVEIIKKTLAWPHSDSLLEKNEKKRLYSILVPLLITANSEGSKQFMEEVFDAAAHRYDSLQTVVNYQGSLVKGEILGEELFAGLADLMSESLRGLYYCHDDRLLDEAITRYDTIHKSARDVFLDYIKLSSFKNTRAKDWLLNRGINQVRQ